MVRGARPALSRWQTDLLIGAARLATAHLARGKSV
jgi:hypothetical protein